MNPDLKHWLVFLACLAALIVNAAALAGLLQRLAVRQFPSLTEAAYFIAGLALLLWSVR